MAAYLISDYYESKSIGQHYQDRESLAVSFLMAMGSKALALTELSEAISISGLDYEANCAHELIRDRFRIKLCEVGCLVNKRARNGHLRTLQIRLQCSQQGDRIEWQSKKIFGGKKTFSLNNLISIDSVHSSDKVKTSSSRESTPEKIETSPSSRISITCLTPRLSITSLTLKRVESDDSMIKNKGLIPFITLINNTRKLNLRFETEHETLIYIDLIRHYYITNPSTNITPAT